MNAEGNQGAHVQLQRNTYIERTMKKFRTRLMKTEKENGERKQKPTREMSSP